MRRTSWAIAYWVLLLSWMTGAVLFMARVKGGFFTNYLSDLTFPAWFYIYARGLSAANNKPPRLLFFGNWFGATRQKAFISILTVGILSEVKTYYLPDGIISGTFDYFDMVSYAVGLLSCYVFDAQKIKQD